jgi:hypothetical protein
MKVEAIRLINFMAFEDTGWVELRPITLLFGRNSSGKSAIIRALLLLKQSLDAEGGERPLAFIKEDGLVDLGDFATAVHRKRDEGEDERQEHLGRSMVFGFRCDLTGEPVLDQVRKLIEASEAVAVTEDELQTLARVELLIGFGWYETSAKVNLLDLRVAGTQSPVVLLECKRLEESDIEGLDTPPVGFVLNSDVAHDSGFDEQTIGLHLREERGFWTTFANPVPQSFEELYKVLSAVQLGVQKFLEGIVHIGPLRPQPERVYALRATDEPRYIRDGLKGWHDFLRNRVDQAQADAMAAWMRRLGLADDVRVAADSDEKPMLRSEVRVSDKVEGMNVKDIGFGASQVLPVIAAAVQSPPDSLIVIEQPELHLHPGAQAKLADLFTSVISQLRTKYQEMDKPWPSPPTFLLETHSENLLLRFRVRLAQTTARKDQEPKLYQEDFGAIFVERNGEVTSVEKIEFDELGAYVQQPKGFVEFFGDDFAELQALRRARSDAAAINQSEG